MKTGNSILYPHIIASGDAYTHGLRIKKIRRNENLNFLREGIFPIVPVEKFVDCFEKKLTICSSISETFTNFAAQSVSLGQRPKKESDTTT